MIRLKGTALIAAVAVIGLAACGTPSSNNKQAGGSSSDTIGGAQQKATDESAKGPAKDIDGAKKGGTMTVYAESTPSTFDPTNIYYTDGNQIAKLAFRTLTQFDIRNGKPVLVPDLAEDLGKVSADKLTWTFKLKKGIKYQDGTPVKAEDFAYAIKRSFAHDVFDAGPTYQLSYFKDADTYKGPYTSGDDYKGVETPDDSTLVIHLKTPFPDLPYYGTFPMFTPIPKAKDTKQKYEQNPMTTGPYMWQSYNPGAELKLVKNPNWDASTDPVRHQYVDAWDFKWGGDAIKSQQQVLASQGPDAAAVEYDNVDASVVPQLTGDKKAQLLQGDSPCTIVEQMDSRKIPLDVRKAIALAYNWDEMNKVSGNNSLTSAPASSILPPAVPGYTKFSVAGLTGTGQGDPAAAKAALQKAGKLGFQLSWYYSNDSQTSSQLTQARTKFLEAAGFKVKAIGVPKAQIRKYTGNYDSPVNMLFSPRGWCSDWPSGSSWFPVLFKSQSVKDGNSIGELMDPALDKKIDDISALPLDQQAAKWGALDQDILQTYVPALPFYYDKMAIVIGNKVGGAVGDPTQGLPVFTQMFIKS
ncbi:peptide/nickel transport system substrate-binding protein [Oryzihumus leptocrescens]|uniref:Peptide/nickel transport system substrate-binding protein n=1 Tax=Oryzihumus leptocrescens TaxID=297536 RepID=A0A542ZKU8_9MICO|nr:peptide/nickel transport system substrate-binding protein [Oryzihumus leptocrescens]